MNLFLSNSTASYVVSVSLSSSLFPSIHFALGQISDSPPDSLRLGQCFHIFTAKAKEVSANTLLLTSSRNSQESSSELLGTMPISEDALSYHERDPYFTLLIMT